MIYIPTSHQIPSSTGSLAHWSCRGTGLEICLWLVVKALVSFLILKTNNPSSEKARIAQYRCPCCCMKLAISFTLEPIPQTFYRASLKIRRNKKWRGRGELDQGNRAGPSGSGKEQQMKDCVSFRERYVLRLSGNYWMDG